MDACEIDMKAQTFYSQKQTYIHYQNYTHKILLDMITTNENKIGVRKAVVFLQQYEQ
jgi:hypothetical protein